MKARKTDDPLANKKNDSQGFSYPDLNESCQSLSDYSTNDQTLQSGTFILHKFNVKNTILFYIGNIIEKLSGKEDGDCKVSYFRKSKKYVGKFIYPSAPDMNMVIHNEIA